ncbi:MAG: hypothetical protein J7K75_05650 [Desulfuromonas sp.]|nr:hypothetical protein [Desulfuromonas sp.]
MDSRHSSQSTKQLEDQAKKAQTERHIRNFSDKEQSNNIKNLLYDSVSSNDD